MLFSRVCLIIIFFLQSLKSPCFYLVNPPNMRIAMFMRKIPICGKFVENTNLWKIPICEAQIQSHCTLLFPKSPLLSSLTYSFALIQSWKQRRSLLWEGSLQNAKVSYLQMDINMANKGKVLANKGYQIIFGATEKMKLPEINLLRCLFYLFCRSEYAHI